MNLNNLRPKFFRYAGGRAYSGWRTPQGDIWAACETRDEVVSDLREGGDNAAAIGEALEGVEPNEHGLCLMLHAEPALRTGEVLEFAADVDLAPLVYIDKGERCVSVRRDKANGSVDLFMQNYFKRLDDYSNCLTIEPHLSDDVIPALRLVAA